MAIEDKLRADPIGAFEVITHNLNLQTPDGQKLTFRDLAWHALNQTPEQQQLIQQRNEAQATRMQLEQMKREQQALANEYRRMQYAAHFQTTRGAVDQYADQRPRFDELGPLIHREIQLGFSLDEAYRRAELLRPATTAAQTRPHDTGSDPDPRPEHFRRTQWWPQRHQWCARRQAGLPQGRALACHPASPQRGLGL